MRPLGTAVTALALAGVTLVGTAGAAWASCGQVDHPSAAATCSTPWGSGTRSATESTAEPLKNIRTGRHDCFDRAVFDITGAGGGATGYHVGYVDAFHQDGTHERLPVKGGAILQVYVNAPSYDPATGRPVYEATAGKALPGVDVSGYRTFRDAVFGASFEGQTQVALGVRAKLPFRVHHAGDRLIVDVAHTW
ncbi:AMIN-like domain-containing (lipo)protein [Streptomyces clavuligerus]|nr:hypothetical protein [Streptomyces clavuligerus]ANW16795.1 hypothetical protein BB341_00405 [Streptomyces clavuligerus]AXU11324.1 hypothetical protein D1794_00460 [Streptomyces clavuligerus]MBY6301131.1 hypothetical protein [Streptomyces clavuligerus]QCS04192.1 hypothetical protein CRV15_00460 [Streptomyces clavuligerus]QPJ96420.1 hypothetical protein GE265_27410 [Streptomyces clavuligerus]